MKATVDPETGKLTCHAAPGLDTGWGAAGRAMSDVGASGPDATKSATLEKAGTDASAPAASTGPQLGLASPRGTPWDRSCEAALGPDNKLYINNIVFVREGELGLWLLCPEASDAATCTVYRANTEADGYNISRMTKVTEVSTIGSVNERTAGPASALSADGHWWVVAVTPTADLPALAIEFAAPPFPAHRGPSDQDPAARKREASRPGGGARTCSG